MVIYGIVCPKANLYSGPNKKKERDTMLQSQLMLLLEMARARFDLQKCHVTCVEKKSFPFSTLYEKRVQVVSIEQESQTLKKNP